MEDGGEMCCGHPVTFFLVKVYSGPLHRPIINFRDKIHYPFLCEVMIKFSNFTIFAIETETTIIGEFLRFLNFKYNNNNNKLTQYNIYSHYTNRVTQW